MPRPERRVVQPNESGGWDVVKPGAPRASAHTGAQAAAITRAQEILGTPAAGEMVLPVS